MLKKIEFINHNLIFPFIIYYPFAAIILETEKEKMLDEELYDPLDRQLSDERMRTR